MMPSWLIPALSLLVNTLLIGALMLGRWSQKVETPPESIALLSKDIQNLTKEIERLSGVFDRRYVTLEGRHNTDHEKLRQLLTDKAVNDEKMFDMRRDIDECRRKCGILHPAPKGTSDE